jgi:hypothetical protein
VGYIALIGIFLALPTTVLGNLLTPKIRDWVATRNIESLKQRRDELSTRLEQLHKIPPIEEAIDAILWQLNGLAFFIGSSVNLIVLAIAVPPLNENWAHDGLPTNYKALALIALALINSYVTIILLRNFEQYRRSRSPRVRTHLQNELTRVEIKMSELARMWLC